jgi:glycerol dehydrogenase
MCSGPQAADSHPVKNGGADRDRTDDLVIANDALFQLSYSPKFSKTAGMQAPPGGDVNRKLCATAEGVPAVGVFGGAATAGCDLLAVRTAQFPGRYVQGAGALNLLVAETRRLGQRCLVLAGRTARRTWLPPLRAAASAAGMSWHLEAFGGACTASEVLRVASCASHLRAELVIGMGGGALIDCAKAAAALAGVPVAVVPTAASTDAPCSACAVLYDTAGCVAEIRSLPTNPQLVVVDTALIAQAPVRLLAAGIGDALATRFEAESCWLSGAPNCVGGYPTLAARALARLAGDVVLAHGRAACAACSAGAVTPELEAVIEANILLSGLGFESAGIAAAHGIHNGLAALPATRSFLHGERVAIGVQAALHLRPTPQPVIDAVYALCADIGLPLRLAEIGLPHMNEADWATLTAVVCRHGEIAHHEPVAVAPAAIRHALLAADARGAQQRAQPVV